MPRFTIRKGPIEIAYGFELDGGVFLSVVDSRLAWNSEASDSVNDVATSVGSEDGDGAYLLLRTSKMGIGRLVDDLTMSTYLARYGVSKQQMFGLPLRILYSYPSLRNSFSKANEGGNLQTADARKGGECSECKTYSTRVCGKCGVMRYCSPDCQKKNWPIHRVFCRMKTIPSDLDPKKSVQVILLPSDGSNPSFIRVPKIKDGEEVAPWERGESINTDMFFEIRGRIRSECFPAAKQAALKKSYHVVYKDDFLLDGRSTANLCIAKLLLDKRATERWRGNVLLCKTDLGHNPAYEDIAMSDVKDAVEFLQDYAEETKDGPAITITRQSTLPSPSGRCWFI